MTNHPTSGDEYVNPEFAVNFIIQVAARQAEDDERAESFKRELTIRLMRWCQEEKELFDRLPVVPTITS